MAYGFDYLLNSISFPSPEAKGGTGLVTAISPEPGTWLQGSRKIWTGWLSKQRLQSSRIMDEEEVEEEDDNDDNEGILLHLLYIKYSCRYFSCCVSK